MSKSLGLVGLVITVLKALAWLVSRQSPNGLGRIAAAITFVAWDLLKLRRRMILRNLDIAFGHEKSPAEQRAIGKQSVYNFALTILETLWSSGNDVVRTVSLRDDQFIRQALDERRGVFILCCHMGNWETMGAACTRLLTPSHVLVKKLGQTLSIALSNSYAKTLVLSG